MNGGMVCASREVSSRSNAYSFQEKIRQKIAVAAMPVDRLRQHDLAERLQPRVAVDQRRLFVFARDFVDEALQQPDRERHVDRGVEQDHADPRVVEAEIAVHHVDRHRDRDRRHHARRQDEEQQIVLRAAP